MNALRHGERSTMAIDLQRACRNDTHVLDTGEGPSPIVDRGAHEFIRPCAADIAPEGGDGAVNVADLLQVITNWGVCSKGTCPADIGGNGQVNVSDLLSVITAWGGCP